MLADTFLRDARVLCYKFVKSSLPIKHKVCKDMGQNSLANVFPAAKG